MVPEQETVVLLDNRGSKRGKGELVILKMYFGHKGLEADVKMTKFLACITRIMEVKYTMTRKMLTMYMIRGKFKEVTCPYFCIS